jgi:hypothetical protein
MQLTEEKFQELSKVLDGIVTELDRLYNEKLYDIDTLYCISCIETGIDNLSDTVSMLDVMNRKIQYTMKHIYIAIKPIYIKCLQPEQFPPYIDKAKERVEEVRTYLEEKRAKTDEK